MLVSGPLVLPSSASLLIKRSTTRIFRTPGSKMTKNSELTRVVTG